ncbi:MAG TPA: cobalamin biosynthesis protein CobW [Thermohalobaculum sp.]|nr:cobalamin biosynthesis protein CobW [Thermohalobaculum sp.]
MPAKIPATVITGFLGAGKTTLIRNLLARANGRRIALVINEFGDIGVDGEVLRGCGDAACAEDDIIELANGCICCTVAEDFVPTMKRLIERAAPPEHIVIETSGLALPQPLVRAFNWPEIRTRVTVDGVIAVVDGPATAEGRFAHDEAAVAAQRTADGNLDHDTPLAELFEDQIACADMVVIAKADRMEAASLDALLGTVAAQARPGARVIRSDAAGLAPDILLGLALASEADMARRRAPHHEGEAEEDHDHDEFETFLLGFGEIADPASYAERLAGVIRSHDILRLKGFAAVAGKPMRLVVQAVGPRVETYYDRPFGPAPRETRLVVIGETGLDRAAITAALAP